MPLLHVSSASAKDFRNNLSAAASGFMHCTKYYGLPASFPVHSCGGRQQPLIKALHLRPIWEDDEAIHNLNLSVALTAFIANLLHGIQYLAKNVILLARGRMDDSFC